MNWLIRISDKAAWLLVVVAMLGTYSLTAAMPPHPNLVKAVEEGTQTEPYFMKHHAELGSRGVDAPGSFFTSFRAARAASLSPTSSTFRILGVLVGFSDKASTVSASFFDSLVFDTLGHTVRDYFKSVSNAQIDLVTLNLPSSLGWRTAPQTYAYYVDSSNGLGLYPHNSQKLVEDLVDQIDPLVDFSNYDNNSDGYVDVLLVIHAGSGAEMTGSCNDIWSHKWGINPRSKDGVLISDYTVQPEYWSTAGDMTIGVYSHELSHGFGLPDLYDTDNSSKGVGRWCIMGYGSWNGTNGSSPSYPCAWSRIQMGFASSTNVSGTLLSQSILNIEQGGPIYRLWTSGTAGSEYFLIENRQKIGYDSYLPGSGLLIWHIDDAKASLTNPNNQEWYPGLTASSHLEVALEQADGLYELEHNIDAGDGGDPFPGSTSKTSFGDTTTPNAHSYLSGSSNVQVANISASATTMTADLVASIVAGTEDPDPTLPGNTYLKQNFPNPFNPATSIRFSIPEGGQITLNIYNVTGQLVRHLLDGSVPWGETTVVWDAKDDHGNSVATGVYFYELTTADRSEVKKMVYLK